MIEKYNLKNTFADVENVTVTGIDQKHHDDNLSALLKAAKAEYFTFNENKNVISVKSLDILGYRVSENKIEPAPSRLQPFLDLPIPDTTKKLKRCLGMFAYPAK